MKKLLLLLLSFSLFSISASAQNFLREISVSSDERGDLFDSNRESRKKVKDGSGQTSLREMDTRHDPQPIYIGSTTFENNEATSISVEKPNDNNYVLYRDILRRHTWIEGWGEPISQDVANHLPFYYRFSMLNKAGHYQLIEAMHGDSLTTKHSMGTYIIDPTDETLNQNHVWKKQLRTVGQWLLFSDHSGEHLIEERAYEAKSKDANLVYVMQAVQNDDRHVTISYLDSWGYPADMNESVAYTYGSVVYITYDDKGRDAIIDYLDGEGLRKKNTDGVDQTRYEYDEKDRVILMTSNNCVGDYAMDNWGNCGMRYLYDDNKNSLTSICIDNYLRPMRMPSIRADEEKTFIRCDTQKDKWGRKVEDVFLTEEGLNDSTSSGIHRITYSYSSAGVLVGKSYYDINGNLIVK